MSATTDHLLTLRDVAEAIERGEIAHLTSDVFDTIVWRPVATPADLFLRLGAELDRRCGGWPDPTRFRNARIEAERRARVRAMVAHGVPECTIEEIWAEMPGDIPLADGVEAELALEASTLRLHPGVATVLDAARMRGVRVTLVSDFYTSSEQLRRLLTGAGLELTGIDVVTSSERRRNKAGGLLADVVGIDDRDRTVHLGDHPYSDVTMARLAGIRSCHVDVLDDDDAVRSAGEPFEHRSRVVATDGGRSAIVRDTLVASGTSKLDAAYQFGVAVAGPMMVGFAGWAARVAAELDATAIHCMLREGDRIAALIDRIDPDAPERVRLHVSRWSITRAAVIEGTADEIESALGRRSDLRAEHLTEAFGCDTEHVRSIIGSVVPLHERPAAFRAIAADDELRSRIVERSAELRRQALTYLERTLRAGEGPLVLCDIGWGGTIQDGIERILRSAGDDRQVVGLYALLSPAGLRRRAYGSDLRCYLPTDGVDGTSAEAAAFTLRSSEALERINTPPIGTVLGYDDSGEPVTRADDHDMHPGSLRSAQRGVDDFCRHWVELVGDDHDLRRVWSDEQGHAAALLDAYARVITVPDPRLAEAMGTWPHDDVAGTDQETLTGSGFGRWLPYANGVDAAKVSMYEMFWVQGAASQARSPLVHQLDALGRGGHPDLVAPPSQTGVARIAVFPPGSELASAQWEAVPRQSGTGWLLLRLATPVPGLRSVRIDLGDVALLAELADVEIVLTTADGAITLVDGTEQLRERSLWVAGRWLSDRRAVVAPGGHCLVDVPADIAGSVTDVAVTIACRTSPLSEAERERWVGANRLRAEALRDSIARRLRR